MSAMSVGPRKEKKKKKKKKWQAPREDTPAQRKKKRDKKKQNPRAHQSTREGKNPPPNKQSFRTIEKEHRQRGAISSSPPGPSASSTRGPEIEASHPTQDPPFLHCRLRIFLWPYLCSTRQRSRLPHGHEYSGHRPRKRGPDVRTFKPASSESLVSPPTTPARSAGRLPDARASTASPIGSSAPSLGWPGSRSPMATLVATPGGLLLEDRGAQPAAPPTCRHSAGWRQRRPGGSRGKTVAVVGDGAVGRSPSGPPVRLGAGQIQSR